MEKVTNKLLPDFYDSDSLEKLFKEEVPSSPMKSKKIKVVIGSNFGDEGKGLMTDYFCHNLSDDDQPILDIRFNGGAQAAHRVVTRDDRSHIFHHFGSGSFNKNVVTYLGLQFVVNPMIFKKEYYEMEKDRVLIPKVFINDNCRVTTPFDMLINQILEDSRGKDRHGSCGIGFNETILRYSVNENNEMTIKDIFKIIDKSSDKYFGLLREELADLKNFLYDRLSEEKVAISERWKNIIESSSLIDNFIDDLLFLKSHVQLVDNEEKFITSFNKIVFEGAQGLLLDNDYKEFAPHLTTSKTGTFIPKELLIQYGLQNEDIEACYVTRTYFTRHGYGPFPTECDKAKIFPKIYNEVANFKNTFQGEFRFGYFDLERFFNAVSNDINYRKGFLPNIVNSIAFTHCDTVNYNGHRCTREDRTNTIITKYGRFNVHQLANSLNCKCVYQSYGETYSDIMDEETFI